MIPGGRLDARLPHLLDLAIWQGSRVEGVRRAALAVLAVGYTLMFVPRK